VPKSTSESQAQITHLLTAPEPARGHWSKDDGKAKHQTWMWLTRRSSKNEV